MNTITNITNFLNTQLHDFFSNLAVNPQSLNQIEYTFPPMIERITIDAFVILLEHIDTAYAQSQERKNSFSIKDCKFRTLTTTFGNITYKRRYYQNKHTKVYYFYIDDLLDLLPYKRCSAGVDSKILANLASNFSITYKQAAAPFGMSKGYVYSLLKNLDFYLDTPDLDVSIPCKQLYIQADEEHIHLQYKNQKRLKSDGKKRSTNYELKEVTIFTGKEKIGKKRFQLKDRVIITQLHNEDNLDFYQRVNDYIQRNYQTCEVPYCYGDRAPWIQSLAEEIGAHSIMDKFHFSQALTRATGGSRYKDVTELLRYYVKSNERVSFEYLVNLHMGLERRTKEYNLKARDYILNNWESYQLNFTLEDHVCCSAEGINSHYFASYFSSRPKGFSIKNIHTIGALRALHNSNIEIDKYYLDNKEEINVKVKTYKSSETYHAKIKIAQSYELHNNLPGTNNKNSGLKKALNSLKS